jgi:hypothetical protein
MERVNLLKRCLMHPIIGYHAGLNLNEGACYIISLPHEMIFSLRDIL